MVIKVNVNFQIRAEKVFLIDETGKSIGPTSTREAIARAKEKGLDLVEVAPNANPPVAKIINFGKYLYQQEKSLQKQKKHRVGELKEVRFGFKTAEHDQEIKIARARKFLSKQHKVRVALRLIGREQAFMPRAFEMIDKFIRSLSDVGQAEGQPKKERNIISIVINPK